MYARRSRVSEPNWAMPKREGTAWQAERNALGENVGPVIERDRNGLAVQP